MTNDLRVSRPTPPVETPELVERVARAICASFESGSPDIAKTLRMDWQTWVPEARAAIASLSDQTSGLREALQQAADAMTCRRDDDAHYCPNCDNSLYDAREKARAALAPPVSSTSGAVDE